MIAGKTYARLWLTVLGGVLLLLGLLGLAVAHPFGTGGPHLEGAELWIHLAVGVGVLGAAFGVRQEAAVASVALAVGVVFLAVGLAGFAVDTVGPWHVGNVDNLVHLLVGAASSAAWWMSREPEQLLAGRPAM